METRSCGTSGIEISILGIGCWSFGGDADAYWGAQDQNDADAVVGRALDAGANYFDTAEGYNEGRSEESLGRSLGRRRHEAVVGSKISPTNVQPATLRAHCDASLRRLGTDYLDIYMVHWPIAGGLVEDAFSTLGALRAEGKIRAIGVSNFGVRDLGRALATGQPIAVDQLYYNLFSRAIEEAILPLCRQEKVGVIGYMPLQQGLLTGKYRTPQEVPDQRARTRHFRGDRPLSRHGGPGAEAEIFAALDHVRDLAASLGVSMAQLSLAWAMARPGVTCTLAGIRNIAQLTDGLAAAALELSPDVMAELDRISQPVLAALGSNPDYWQTGADTRIR